MLTSCSETIIDHLTIGNAATDTTATRGWLIGHFMTPDDLRHGTNVEVKWGTHRAGERRDAWADIKHVRSLALLISGNFTMLFPDRHITLTRPGDYVLYDDTLPHRWRSDEDSVVITVRWLTN